MSLSCIGYLFHNHLGLANDSRNMADLLFLNIYEGNAAEGQEKAQDFAPGQEAKESARWCPRPIAKLV